MVCGLGNLLFLLMTVDNSESGSKPKIFQKPPAENLMSNNSIAQEGQGKWVTCVVGSIWDVVVDIRPSSPTYKKWIGMELSEGDGKSIFVSEGLGHAFISLEENSVVSYLLTTAYSSSEEFDINPFDPELAIEWPKSLTPIMSAKDSSAPSLCARFLEGKLPS